MKAEYRIQSTEHRLINRFGLSVKRSVSVAVYALSSLMLLFSSCEKKADAVEEQQLSLTLSADSVYCLPVYKDLPALEMAWTAGSNHGTGSAISYILEMDKEGNNFAGAYVPYRTRRCVPDLRMAYPGYRAAIRRRADLSGSQGEDSVERIHADQPLSGRRCDTQRMEP